MTPTQERIISLLEQCGPLTLDEIVRCLYTKFLPADAECCVKVQISRLRKQGWTIASPRENREWGKSRGRYALEGYPEGWTDPPPRGRRMTLDAADRQAAAIKRYWARRGYFIRVTVEEVDRYSGHHPIYGVRSNLINGWPRELNDRARAGRIAA